MRFISSIAIAALLSVSGVSLATPAEAGRWHGGHGWRPHHYPYGPGPALFGLAAGLAIGGALAPGYHGYPGSGYYGGPYYYPPPAYYPPPVYYAQPYYRHWPGSYRYEIDPACAD